MIFYKECRLLYCKKVFLQKNIKVYLKAFKVMGAIDDVSYGAGC